MTESRASKSTELLTINYSAGINLIELRAFYPAALEYWESYAHCDRAYNDTKATESKKKVAHFALLGSEFWDVNRMVCFGILLGWQQLIPRLIPIIEYNNPKMDGMLERLFILLGIKRDTPPDESPVTCRILRPLKFLPPRRNSAPD